MNASSSPSLREKEHPGCFACAPHHPYGLRLCFQRTDDGGVTATLDCTPAWQGYTGLVHGGIIALMLDAAMTNCLFQHDVPTLTAQLNLRFREPLLVGRSAVVSARIIRETANAFVVEGNVFQGDRLKAKGEGIFMRKAQTVVPRHNGGR